MPTVIMCSRGKKSLPNCSICGTRDASQLCDFILPVGDIGHKRTCDAPLCISCRYTPDGKQDFCPTHAEIIRGQL